MKQVCLVCDRTAPQATLFCQDARCPAERAPLLLDRGDRLEDLEIVAPVAALRAAVLYNARRGDQPVLLKVAHSDPRAAERLKREARLLGELLGRDGRPPPGLPTLLGPYSGTNPREQPYGSTMLGGQLLYFALFAPFDGQPLSAFLARNPQPWVNHAGWIAHSFAVTVGQLHSRGVLHLALSPESALVRLGQNVLAPELLLCDLGLVASPADVATGDPKRHVWHAHWYRELAAPGYTAPELVPSGQRGDAVGYHTDVYGVGLILYEMLIGRPAFPAARLDDESVYALVRANRLPSMTRALDAPSLAAVANRAVSRQRYDDLQALDQAVIAVTGLPPVRRRRFWQQVERPLLAIAALLIIAFVVAFALDLASIF